MDQELDPSFVELTEEEEAILKEHALSSGSEGRDSDGGASDADESYFTLDELISEFNETKVANSCYFAFSSIYAEAFDDRSP